VFARIFFAVVVKRVACRPVQNEMARSVSLAMRATGERGGAVACYGGIMIGSIKANSLRQLLVTAKMLRRSALNDPYSEAAAAALEESARMLAFETRGPAQSQPPRCPLDIVC
jgi:hypothetical protein